MNDDFKEMLARIDERTDQTQKDVDLLKHVILEGNGTPAMTVRVATQDERLKALEEHVKENKIPRNVSLGIIVSIVIAVFSSLVGFVK
jgi:hypothetical protein